MKQISFFWRDRKFATVSFVVSVRPPVSPSTRMEQLGFHYKNFHEIWYLNIFRKSVERI